MRGHSEGICVNIVSFDDLLQAARHQQQAQRLLLVFAGAELPEDSSAEQRAQFEAGTGGALVPLMCVDKSPDELASFSALKQESRQFECPWQVLFASSLSGSAQAAPTSKATETALQTMVESIKQGRLANMIAFDTQGQALSLD